MKLRVLVVDDQYGDLRPLLITSLSPEQLTDAVSKAHALARILDHEQRRRIHDSGKASEPGGVHVSP